MNLKTFQKHVNPNTLQKGKIYFDESRVVDLENFDDTFWSSSVMGTEEYFVEVLVDQFKIKEYTCDCPDENLICKHVVAVFYGICEEKGVLKTISDKAICLRTFPCDANRLFFRRRSE